MMEHDEKGIWYFTNVNRAATYICTVASNINRVLDGKSKKGKVKGWTPQWVDADNIMSKYINPER